MRVELPRQLRNPSFRFCKVARNGKNAIEKDWQTNVNYSYTSLDLHTSLRNDYNYGVIGGWGNLLILDFDTYEAYTRMCELLPPTFAVKSASKGLPHLYYTCQYSSPNSVKIFDEERNTLIDVQGHRKYCVGPGSKVENQFYYEGGPIPQYRTYKVWKDLPIATIDYEWLVGALKEEFGEYIREQKPKTIFKKRFEREFDDRVDKVKRNIDVPRMLRHYGIDTQRSPTDTPLANSTSKKCLDFEKDVWYDFNTQQGGDVITLARMVEGFGFTDALDWLEETFNV